MPLITHLIDPVVRDASVDAAHPPATPAERQRGRRLVAAVYLLTLGAVATWAAWPWGG